MEKPPVNPDDYKYLGSVLGSIQSMVFFFPKTLMEGILRFVFSFIAGSLWFFIILEYMEWERSPEKIVASSALVALGSAPLMKPVLEYVRKKFGD